MPCMLNKDHLIENVQCDCFKKGSPPSEYEYEDVIMKIIDCEFHDFLPMATNRKCAIDALCDIIKDNNGRVGILSWNMNLDLLKRILCHDKTLNAKDEMKLLLLMKVCWYDEVLCVALKNIEYYLKHPWDIGELIGTMKENYYGDLERELYHHLKVEKNYDEFQLSRYITKRNMYEILMYIREYLFQC